MNSRNFGIATGRLTREPVIFVNRDGSRKIMFTVAAQNDYKNKDTGTRDTQFIPMETFVSAASETNGVYDYMHKGDLVTVEYTVHADSYEKDGVMVYATILFAQNVTLLDNKATSDARQAKAAAPAAVPAAAPKAAKAKAAVPAAPEATDEPAFGK